MKFSRTELLIGKDSLDKLKNATVAIFGIGGVGSFALEAIARAGVGHIIIADCDTVDESNINRQLLALHSNIGELKTEAATLRIKDINPDIKLTVFNEFVKESNLDNIFDLNFNYAIDAIDTIESKVSLISKLYHNKISFISAMGAAHRLTPTNVKISDISKTKYCPLARIVRRKLKAQHINKGVKCVYSEEVLNLIPKKFKPPKVKVGEASKSPLGTISYMPGIFGLTAAGAIIQDIIEHS